MLTTQHTTDIITKFETYLDDSSELSSQEELELANKIYQEICDDRPWEFLKKAATGTLTVSNGVATIPVPSDFKNFAENNQATDGAVSTDNNASPKVIFLSTTTGVYTPYQIVNFSDRRQYLNSLGYAYLDLSNNQIVFTALPSVADLSYEFDYIKIPPDLTAATTAPYSDPLFPARFWDAIYHKMAADDQIIQIFDRAHSYLNENLGRYKEIMSNMALWNANLINY